MRTADDLVKREMDLERFPRTKKLLKWGVEQQVSPGMVAGVWQSQSPEEIFVTAVGDRRIVPTRLPMTVDTVFDLASVTKVFGTAALVAVLVEKRWITWDLPVKAVLPSYPYSDVLVSHLLSHTAGYAAYLPFWEQLRKQFAPLPLYRVAIEQRQRFMRDLVFAVRPEQQPGMRVLYSDISFLLLGFLLENLLGLSLDHAIERWVWHPMGITGASFRRVSQSPQLEIDPLVAATEQCPWRGAILQGQVHDDNCWAMGGFAGHAGAFARVQDVLQFARGLGLGFLSPQVLSAFWKRVTLPVGCERTLGWDTPSLGKSSAGTLFSQASVGHLGFTGTSLWIDPQAEVAVCLLTNRVHPSRDSLLIREFRPQFHDAVRLDLIG